MPNDSQPKFQIVKDQGGNVGLLCPDCNQARWTNNYKPVDWATQEVCNNCLLIQQNNSIATEQEKEAVRLQREQEEKQAEEAEAEQKVIDDATPDAPVEPVKESKGGVSNG